MPIDTVKTGAAIAAHRQRMNLSQQGLAGLMNVTHQAVSKWEKGLALPDTETLLALAKLFGTTMEDLLTGVLPQADEPVAEETASFEQTAPLQEIPADDKPVQIPPAEMQDLDFSSIMNMLPFVSTKVADQLFLACASPLQPDASKLLSIAPFVSTRVLADYVTAHPFKDSSPEVIASLAPFLPTKAVDDMILGMEAPLPPHVVQMLMPFASSRVADQMVMNKLGIHDESNSHTQADLSRKIQDKVHQKIMQKLDFLDERNAHFQRESPRMRLIRKAVENGQYDIIEDSFDELDAGIHLMLLKKLSETSNEQLLALMCENAGELASNVQLALIELLLKDKEYDKLAEIIPELTEDIQHQLLSKAFAINDPELLHLISEHLD